MITVKDIQKAEDKPQACKDDSGRLRVGAAVGTGADTDDRVEALMGGMEDNWSFDVTYQGQSIASIEWHDGLKARDALKQCLAGKAFDNKSHLRD